MGSPGPFAELGLLLLAALAGGLGAHLLRQPPLVGYVLAGVALAALPQAAESAPFELFAQVGLVLLLFTAGVEFSLSDLWRARRLAFYGTPVGMAMIVGLVTGLGVLAGWSVKQAAAVGLAASVMSTAVLFKSLHDRNEMGSAHGKILVAVSLAQDLTAVLLMAFLPVLASGGEVLQDKVLAFARAAALVPLLWFGRRVVPTVLSWVASARSMELFLVTVVVLAVGTAALASSLGLSPALGAFLAGLVVSESEFAHETLARVLPLRDVFVALFFLSVGLLVRPETLALHLPTVLGIAAVVVLGNSLVWASVVRAAGYPLRVAVLCGLGLGQIGEFSYLLAASAVDAGLMDRALYQSVLGASLITVLINALLFRTHPRWLETWLARHEEPTPGIPIEAGTGRPLESHVVLCGFGRVGQEVAQALEAFGIPYAVVDLDPESLQTARSRGAVAVFGDVGSSRALRRAGVDRARLVVVAVPDPGAAFRGVQRVRQLNPEVPVLARAHHAAHRALLLEAGATEVVQPEVEAALTIIRHTLDWVGVSHQAGRAYLKAARGHWPEAMRSEGPAAGLESREVVVRSGRLIGRSLRQVRLTERTGAVVAAVTHPDGRQVVDPRPEQVLQRGDRLLAIGEPEQLDALERACGSEESGSV